MSYVCTECNANIDNPTKSQKDIFKRAARVYCNSVCSGTYRSRISSETMAATNRKYASDRMTRNNPMKREATRQKVRTTLRAMGWTPTVRGGNGTGPTVPQLLLASRLGWELETVVRTLQPKDSGYPSCYKLDIGNRTLKVGIEIDGNAHLAASVKVKDEKKTAFLSTLGWKILRFTNSDVMEHSNDCVQAVLDAIKTLPV